MLLAVKKEPGYIPGSGFHYMLHPIEMSSEGEAGIFELMGYTILRMNRAEGDKLIASAKAALVHQIEVATLCELALKKEREDNTGKTVGT